MKVTVINSVVSTAVSVAYEKEAIPPAEVIAETSSVTESLYYLASRV